MRRAAHGYVSDEGVTNSTAISVGLALGMTTRCGMFPAAIISTTQTQDDSSLLLHLTLRPVLMSVPVTFSSPK